jgi:dTDP-4-dehydrorhamnose reductase
MRVLITGLSGYLGQFLYSYRPQTVTLSGTYYSNSHDLPARNAIFLDLQDVQALTKLPVTYDMVIHAAANANLADCEKNEAQAFKVNSDATEILARWSQKQGSRFIYFSTDIVFQGDRGNYTEEDTPKPVNIYGQSKWQGERILVKNHSNYAICRLSLTLGKAKGRSKNFIDHFVRDLYTGKEILLFEDEWRTPITPHYVAKAVWEIACSNYQGIIHLCGAEKMNRYQLGLKMAAYLNFTAEQLKKAYAQKAVFYPRPLDVSMCSLYAQKVLTCTPQKISAFFGDML